MDFEKDHNFYISFSFRIDGYVEEVAWRSSMEAKMMTLIKLQKLIEAQTTEIMAYMFGRWNSVEVTNLKRQQRRRNRHRRQTVRGGKAVRR